MRRDQLNELLRNPEYIRSLHLLWGFVKSFPQGSDEQRLAEAWVLGTVTNEAEVASDLFDGSIEKTSQAISRLYDALLSWHGADPEHEVLAEPPEPILWFASLDELKGGLVRALNGEGQRLETGNEEKNL